MTGIVKKHLFGSLLWLSPLLVILLPGTQGTPSKIAPEVRADLNAGKEAEVLVVFSARADLRAADQLRDKVAKGRYVVGQLQQTARSSQRDLQRWLVLQHIPFRSFWIANVLAIRADAAVLEVIAARPEVARIVANPWIQMVANPELEKEALELRGGAIEWGIAKINAPAVWQMGYQGEGIVVGGQDTGYDWQHPALKDKYRGWDGTAAVHDYNWHDAIHDINPLNGDSLALPQNNPCGLDAIEPCDDNGHGTHTMGTMVGAVGETEQIGVAPAAKWISCRNMERGWGKPSTYIECFEWFVAPTDLKGQNPKPEQAPHIINNSWGCPDIEGCNPDATRLMEEVVNNVRAAGIFVVVSAGNSGRDCGSVETPAAIFESSFSVGATDTRDSITSFSSRGPVEYDGKTYLKPNVVAPGQSVRSSFPGGLYGRASGTSMAGPHVAGMTALLLNANPALIGNVDLISDIIQQSALPLFSGDGCTVFPGNQRPNTVYGYGRIDALSAVRLAAEQVNSAEDPDAGKPVRIFPNPFGDYLVIEGHPAPARLRIELYDLSGRLQLNRQLDDQATLTLPRLSPGLYLYRISEGSNLLQSGKLVGR